MNAGSTDQLTWSASDDSSSRSFGEYFTRLDVFHGVGILSSHLATNPVLDGIVA